MSEELKLNENVGAPQPDALAQIASVDPSPAVGGMHRFTPAMLSRLKKQRQLLSDFRLPAKNHGVMPLGLFFLFTIPALVAAGSGKREAADCQPLRVARLGVSPQATEKNHLIY